MRLYPIGYVAVAEIPVAINQGFIAIKPKEDVSNLFFLLWLGFAHDVIISRANGSTFLEISKSNFRPIPIINPGSQVMATYDQQVRPIYERIVTAEQESRTLADLRDTLLPKLISGELRIEDADRFVSEAGV
jgi:type I restriction enzyme S subunit